MKTYVDGINFRDAMNVYILLVIVLFLSFCLYSVVGTKREKNAKQRDWERAKQNKGREKAVMIMFGVGFALYILVMLAMMINKQIKYSVELIKKAKEDGVSR